MNAGSRITSARRLRGSAAAFTMIEIAISLAVIGFALVAIIGVLPFGMDVQKQNREETIIKQDATIFMNAIRNGARGLDYLTNYVIGITNTETFCDYNGVPSGTSDTEWYTPDNSSLGAAYALTNGYRIIGLLGMPKYAAGQGGFYSNYVAAAFRALSGPSSETFPQTNTAVQDLALSYRMICDVVPYGTSYANPIWTNPMSPNLQMNLHEVRLLFRWPLAKGTNAQGRQAFQTVVSGLLTNDLPGRPYYYFFHPQTYVKAQTP